MTQNKVIQDGKGRGYQAEVTEDNELKTTVANMIPDVETGLAKEIKQLPNDHDVNVTNMIPAVETGLSTSAKQLPNDHDVNVTNMIPDVETGLAKESKQLPNNHDVNVTNDPLNTLSKITDGTLIADLKNNSHTTHNEILVNLEGHICAENSTSENLDPDEVFSGEWQDAIDHGMIIIGISSDKDSATDGLMIQWSADGITVHDSDTFSILANKGKVFTFGPARRYFRIIYTNGIETTTAFNLQSQLKRVYVKPSSHRTSDIIVGDDDAELVKATVTGEDVNTGAFVNVGTVAGEVGNNLLVSVDQVEQTTNSLKVIDYSHAELHSGNHYHVNEFEALAKNGTRDILIVTPNTTRWAHAIFEAATTASPVVVTLFEDVTTSNDGTLDGARNRNRNYPDDNTTLVYNNPTVTDTGTQLHAVYIGSGRGDGDGARDAEETLLKQNTKYLFRFEEQNVTSTVISWVIDWYEHTNK